MSEGAAATKATAGGMSALRKAMLALIATLLVGSVAARAFVGGGEAEEPAPEPKSALTDAGGQGFLPGLDGKKLPGLGGGTEEPAAPAEEHGALEGALPYLTEGSFFALIGFALGYASKKVVKVGLILLAVFFAGIQALSWSGVVTVDWGKAVDLANDLILNLKENETFTEDLKDRVPTVGALVAGYLLGFRRG